MRTFSAVVVLIIILPAVMYGQKSLPRPPRPVIIETNTIVKIKATKMKKVNSNYEDLHWLSLNLYHEARGEVLHGMMAVAFVTLNRTHHRRFPNTIKEVVQQPHQFSWYSDGLSDTPTDMKAWSEAQDIAQLSLGIYNAGAAKTNNDDSPDWLTNGALFYYNPKKVDEPYWIEAENMVKTADIGDHLFYNL